MKPWSRTRRRSRRRRASTKPWLRRVARGRARPLVFPRETLAGGLRFSSRSSGPKKRTAFGARLQEGTGNGSERVRANDYGCLVKVRDSGCGGTAPPAASEVTHAGGGYSLGSLSLDLFYYYYYYFVSSFTFLIFCDLYISFAIRWFWVHYNWVTYLGVCFVLVSEFNIFRYFIILIDFNIK